MDEPRIRIANDDELPETYSFEAFQDERPTVTPAAERILEAVEHMSRRIEDLARELNCLGYFDDDDDGPRAA